ncbi:hypothetical protein [Microbacterium trichothecenolyticum]|uniref:Peptidoglycan hydrolase-like protein with peptidoglycan-binding domain n=1 Tax=Microbacterium trichothecenolyticum TaxID=69370 RepID=A0ABU0TRD8_MICTR|nr:hypothetical protein [Microbacterium trichothecenolyticum]MDQ1122238.1 peptidoglycan hydrolase-like protein with peptidoglycan-binding domain [Microbacterium trichothecenolyticum]
MATLKNHRGHWLRDDAAAAFDRLEDDHGVFGVNSAGRSVESQNGLIRRWDQGGPANRPPYLYEPARPAERSNHVANGGIAVDVADPARFTAVCGPYGFVQPYPKTDPVHFEFRGGGAAGGSGENFPARARYGGGFVLFTQDLLGEFGHNTGGRDGKDGLATQAAVLHEQGAAEGNGFGRIARDGIGGPDTVTYLLWAFLNYRARPDETPGQPARSRYGSTWVRYVQRLAAALGHDLGPDGVDGQDGPRTQEIVRFEQAMAAKNGYGTLAVDGIGGYETAKYLLWAVVKFRLPWN